MKTPSLPHAAGEAAQTPGPFLLREWDDVRYGSHGYDIEAHPDFNAGLAVAVCSGPDCAANAAFIVRACNENARLHADKQALRAALKEVADEVRAYPDSPRSYSSDSYLPEGFQILIRAALKATE